MIIHSKKCQEKPEKSSNKITIILHEMQALQADLLEIRRPPFSSAIRQVS